MTKTTEELKREMYKHWESAMRWVSPYSSESSHLHSFESALEAYLEALRQETEALKRQGNIALDAYTHQQTLTMQARSEADRERNRAQAFEFANKSAGEFLQGANNLVKVQREKIDHQRQSIGKLKNERDNAVHALKVKTTKLEKSLQELSEARKFIPGTWVEENRDRVSQTVWAACESIEKAYSGIDCGKGIHHMLLAPIPYCIGCGFKENAK